VVLFRPNVAALVILPNHGGVLGCYRPDYQAWQCVQGGLEPEDATPEEGMIRELEEELGVRREDFRIVYRSQFWRRYTFTDAVKQMGRFPGNLGQEQMWFLVELTNPRGVDLKHASSDEFSKTAVFKTLDDFLQVYTGWKFNVFFDFCREIRSVPQLLTLF
jgi:putative (di)nucleoside polyphosphate hydrolase